MHAIQLKSYQSVDSTTLSQETVATAIDFFAAEHEVSFKKSFHRKLLVERNYKSMKDVQRAILRYKVFVDVCPIETGAND